MPDQVRGGGWGGQTRVLCAEGPKIVPQMSRIFLNWVIKNNLSTETKKSLKSPPWHWNISLFFSITLFPFSILSNIWPNPLIIYKNCNVVVMKLIWGRFHQRFTSSFYACRSQKYKKTLMTRLSYCAFGIFARKSFA